jgi:metal-responsive CopG/Arc/MetJ family transcriptional regulator
MSANLKNVDRLTISLPKNLSNEVERIRRELNVPKSEIFRIAIEKFLEQYRKRKIQKIAKMMADEYEKDQELTLFTSLDSEDFK